VKSGMAIQNKSHWVVWGTAVRGLVHAQRGLPCQDAILWVEADGESRRVILAIADGHGSERSPFSERGAQIAVAVATRTLAQFHREAVVSDPRNLVQVKRTAESHLPAVLVAEWRKGVQNDFARVHPESQLREGYDLWRQYGTTLLAVLATDRFILSLQIGDGDIVLAAEDEQTDRAVPRDSRLMGVETTSISSDRAIADFRIGFNVVIGLRPVLVMASTDGYFNSFVEEAGFLQAAQDYLRRLREHGAAYLQSHLAVWLEETSRRGSGDDITVGLIWRANTVDYASETSETEATAHAGTLEGSDSPADRVRSSTT